jgi:hypothetical protein
LIELNLCTSARSDAISRRSSRALSRWRRREGFYDERPEVMSRWESAHTWVCPPVALAGDVLPPALRYEFVVGFTRLGNLLGALDRGDVPEVATHRVWIGQRQ